MLIEDQVLAVATELGEKFEAFKAKQEERFNLVEQEFLALKRPMRPGATTSSGIKSNAGAKAALRAYLSKGDSRGLDELQQKTMSVDSDPDGGFAVPEYLDTELEKLELDSSAIARLARTVQAAGPVYKKIVNLRGTASGWVGETDTRPETATPQLSAVEITVGELYANPKLTQQIVDDAMFDAELFITEEIGNEFADQLGAALLHGDGVNKPKGILTKTITTQADSVRAFGTLQAVETSALNISFDDLKRLKSALRAKYRDGAAWVMNDTTALALSLLKDSTGQYLWRESLTEGEPDTLFGYPVEIDENMPDVAADSYPVLFGNFQRGYYLVRRKDIRLLRDPYTSKPYINFYTTERVGGDVVNSECIKLLKIASA